VTEVRYYTDEQVSKAVIRGLRQRGVDVTSVPEANKLGATDEEHLAFALAEGRVIFTQDDDFLRLGAAKKVHPGIVYAPQHTPVGQIIQGLMLIHDLLTAEEMIGNVEFL
jgi:predicted nuclease of predicted toxin-antitoxin system